MKTKSYGASCANDFAAPDYTMARTIGLLLRTALWITWVGCEPPDKQPADGSMRDTSVRDASDAGSHDSSSLDVRLDTSVDTRTTDAQPLDASFDADTRDQFVGRDAAAEVSLGDAAVEAGATVRFGNAGSLQMGTYGATSQDFTAWTDSTEIQWNHLLPPYGLPWFEVGIRLATSPATQEAQVALGALSIEPIGGPSPYDPRGRYAAPHADELSPVLPESNEYLISLFNLGGGFLTYERAIYGAEFATAYLDPGVPMNAILHMRVDIYDEVGGTRLERRYADVLVRIVPPPSTDARSFLEFGTLEAHGFERWRDNTRVVAGANVVTDLRVAARNAVQGTVSVQFRFASPVDNAVVQESTQAIAFTQLGNENIARDVVFPAPPPGRYRLSVYAASIRTEGDLLSSGWSALIDLERSP